MSPADLAVDTEFPKRIVDILVDDFGLPYSPEESCNDQVSTDW